MEMSPNTASSALLLRSVWLLFLLTPITQTTDAPTPDTSLLVNTTLLFDSGGPGHDLRNCSCSTPVQDCDEALANSLCRCHSVLRSALPLAGLRDPGQLTVWVKELWVLEELLNRSMVGHLQLSFCGVKPMHSQYLALLGLRTLRIHSEAPEAPYRTQEITLLPAVELEALTFDLSTSFHLTILDVAVLNGLSALKAYSVVGPPAPILSQHFPLLATPLALPPSAPGDPVDPGGPLQKLLITFVY
ncbi:exosomal polycystin-1-interacting protein-like [Trachinotus anak]|uniref:exosomal polycystin-1-interacting protein-like n=1 Tax=Trachinotus anak TaxID=443729 RepID=UPI0039F1C07A